MGYPRHYPDRAWRRGGYSDYAENRISERGYAGGNAMFALYGMLLTLVGQQYTFKLGINPEKAGALVLGLIVLVFVGVFMMALSDKPPVSFLGLTFIAGSFGLVLGIVEPGIAVPPLVASTSVAVVMAFAGWFLPANLYKWGSWLLGLTTALIVVQILMPIIESYGVSAGTYQRPAWLDVATVVLFSGWLIYDLNRARRMPRNLDTMIDNGGAIYLDWLNIYLALRNLMGDD